jgi:hypothetical protein
MSLLPPSIHSYLWFYSYLAKKWNIPFEDLCSYLVDKVGIIEVKKNLGRSDVLGKYGSEALKILDNI